MLYVPDTNFLFVHIPRTGGNAVTRQLVKLLVGDRDFIVNTYNAPLNLCRHAPTWTLIDTLRLRDNLPQVFIIDRPEADIIESDYKLFRSWGNAPPFGDPCFQAKVGAALAGRREFNAHWQRFLKQGNAETIFEWWNRGFEQTHPDRCTVIPYSQLGRYWRKIAVTAGVKRTIAPLEWSDFELQQTLSR